MRPLFSPALTSTWVNVQVLTEVASASGLETATTADASPPSATESEKTPFSPVAILFLTNFDDIRGTKSDQMTEHQFLIAQAANIRCGHYDKHETDDRVSAHVALSKNKIK